MEDAQVPRPVLEVFDDHRVLFIAPAFAEVALDAFKPEVAGRLHGGQFCLMFLSCRPSGGNLWIHSPEPVSGDSLGLCPGGGVQARPLPLPSVRSHVKPLRAGTRVVVFLMATGAGLEVSRVWLDTSVSRLENIQGPRSPLGEPIVYCACTCHCNHEKHPISMRALTKIVLYSEYIE